VSGTDSSAVWVGVFLAVLASESVLLYASTALADVGLKFGKWLLASSGTAIVWAAVGCGFVLVAGLSFFPRGNGPLLVAAALALALAWLATGLLFAYAFSTSAWRGLLVSAYQLLLRAVTGAVVGATAVLLLRLFLAASAPTRGGA
jgi:hypothetical protein